MSERHPNPGPEHQLDPQLDTSAAPVAEIEAEIKAEIAAEMQAERDPAGSAPAFSTGGFEPGADRPIGDDPGVGDAWTDPPPPVADPAAEVLAWLRGEFDDVNANLQSLSNRLSCQEEALLRITGSQVAELNSTLAELEGCSAQLRNEAATLRDTRSQLALSLPKLVSDAVESAVVTTIAGAVAEMRGTVAQLGAALAEALPAALADAVTPVMAEMAPIEATAAPAPPEADDDGSEPGLVSQLHEAQDEAAEWFSIVVDEAVRRAVERWLAPAVAGASPDPGSPFPAAPGSTDDANPEIASDPATAEPAATDPASPADLAVNELVTPIPELSVVPDSGASVEATEPGAPVDESVVAVAPPSGADEPKVVQESGITCVLPGVAVGPTLAMGVSAALGRARLRRRRRRRAGAPAAGLFRHDPFAGELSQRLERFALARRDLAWRPDPAPPGAGDGADGHHRPTVMAPVVVAERGGREIAVDLAARPMALSGPDADNAGRALIASFLAADQTSTGRVVAAAELLPPGQPFPGLDRFVELSSALDDLEAEVTRRKADADEHPRVVLVASVPSPDLAGRLHRLAESGPAVGVSVVVVGPARDAGAVTVEAGGRVRDVASSDGAGLAGARMFCLGLSAMSEVLGVLAAARTDDEPLPVVEVRGEPFPVLTGADPAPIQVRVLGPYRIDVGGEEIRSGLRAKARELLAFYLLHPEGTTLDVATEALWPEADAGRGSEWFWTALGNLRSRLRSVTGTKELKIIERDGDRYRIEPVFDVDLWRFQAALPPLGASTGDPDWAAALQNAADMYDGELLAGVDWAWADVPREDLRRRAVDVLVSLGATRLVAGDVRGALDVLSHAVEVDPVAEQLYRRIMRLHARQSRPDEVEATFGRLKARLGELDLEPTAESEQLVAELVE